MSNNPISTSDLVRREDVIRYIRDNIILDTFMKRTVNKADEACWDLCDKLKNVPVVDTASIIQWVSVNEKLPKEDGEYLVTKASIEDFETVLSIDIAKFEHSTRAINNGFHKADLVVAWAVLPQCYDSTEV